MEPNSFDSPDAQSTHANSAPGSDDTSCEPCRACQDSHGDPSLTRRELFARAASALGVVLVSGTAAGALLSGCGSQGNGPGGNGPGGPGGGPGGPPGASVAGVAAKAEGSDFRVAGGGKLAPGTGLAFTYGASNDPGILFVDGDQLKALSARCTHAGCVVIWTNEGGPHLHCPCHSSNFDLTGKVLNGPAKKDLPKFKVKKDGNDALVTPA